jgi:hypothetical protein
VPRHLSAPWGGASRCSVHCSTPKSTAWNGENRRRLSNKSARKGLDVCTGLFDDDLDGVADRMDAIGREAAVSRVSQVLPNAEVVDLDAVRQRAAGQ